MDQTLKRARIVKKISEALKFKPNNELVKRTIVKIKPLMEFSSAHQAVYRFEAHAFPELMEEVGRLRENSWKFYGLSSGKDLDIDYYDTNCSSYYQQVFVWDTLSEEILGGCRYVSMVELRERFGTLPAKPDIHTFKLFDASHHFIENYLPYMMELQRVFVLPRVVPSLKNVRAAHTPFVLDNMFKAIGKQVISKEKIKYVTGRASFPPMLFSTAVTDKIIRLLHEKIARYDLLLPKLEHRAKVSGVRIPLLAELPQYTPTPTLPISQLQREYQTDEVPIILKVYLNQSNTIYFFGGLIHPEFGNSIEIAILTSIADFFPRKRERYFTKEYSAELSQTKH